MRSLLLLLLFILVGQKALSQHCIYDNRGAVVLNIHSKKSPKVIPGLKVELLDSLNNPIGEFRQNLSAQQYQLYLENFTPGDSLMWGFPFAKDNYVLVVTGQLKPQKYKIRITDAKGKKPKTTVVPLTRHLKACHLCLKDKAKEYPECPTLEIII